MEMHKKNSKFKWTQRQSLAFKDLKEKIAEKLIVKIFDPRKEVKLITGLSECAVSASLSQDHPIMYFSRRLMTVEINYLNFEKETLTIAYSTDRTQ